MSSRDSTPRPPSPPFPDHQNTLQAQPDPQATKRCLQCKVEKPLDCFSWVARDRKSAGHCNECAYAMTKRWRECNKERHKKQQAEYRRANREKLHQKELISRAISRGIPLDAKKKCSKCGVEKLVYQGFVWQPRLNRVRPECKACGKRRSSSSSILRNREVWLYRKYRLTPDDYDALFAGQGGVCAICGTDDPKSPGGKNFIIDHDHRTGQIRGLLCNRCNLLLGYLGDDLQGVMRFVAYLVRAQIDIKEQVG